MDPKVAKRWLVRLSVVVVAASVVLMYLSYGLLSVPRGMDTMPDTHPPGAVCLIQKWPSTVAERAVVFVDVEGGATVLSRVEKITADGKVSIRHDNRRSEFCYLEAAGPYDIDAVRGLVLTMFITEPVGEPQLDR